MWKRNKFKCSKYRQIIKMSHKMNQQTIIGEFSKDAAFTMIKFKSKNDEEFGKILTQEELLKVDLHTNEIHRSAECRNGDNLFVFDLKPKGDMQGVDNPLQLLINNLKEARVIELIYRGIFRWIFNGINIKGYAIVPSGDVKSNSTITRYGGTELFIRILKQHLKNISKMYRGLTPDYNFLSNKENIEETELSLGSINMFNKMYSVGIDLSMSYRDIIRNSKRNKQVWQPLNRLKMKYWVKEINPDFIVEAKHIKLKDTIPIDTEFKLYPQCIKNLMTLRTKGNYYRFLLARFLLSIHKPKDAKFIYDSVLSEKEKAHITYGNCSTQWNYILNNLKLYNSPTCCDMQNFCDKSCKLVHPLQKIQVWIEEKKNEER